MSGQHAGGTGTPAPLWSAESHLTLERLVFPARHAGIVAVALVIPFITSIGDRRWPLLAAVLLGMLPLDIACGAWTRRHGRFPVVMPIANLFLGVGLSTLAPQVFPAVLLLLLSDTAFTALIFGRRTSVTISLFGTALMGLVATAIETSSEAPLLAAYAIGGVATSWIIGTLGEREREVGERYGNLIGEVDVIVWEMVPGTDRFSYVSPAAEEVLGYPVEQWYEPRFWVDHLHPEDAERAEAECDEAIVAGVDHVLEYRMVAADGRAVHLRDVASVKVDGEGRAVMMRGVMMDVSDRRRAEELLQERATHDALTGLPNRSLFGDRLDQALREATRTGDPIALLILDLDDFKEVNDALGHEAGDRLLVAFADRLRDEVRDCDTIARLGGDEFGLLLTTDAGATGAVAVADRVVAIAERPFNVDGLHLQAGASIGIALYPDHASDAATLSARADVAMYLAKRSGRGTALYEPELDRSSVRRLSLLGQLREAIAADELDLDFQPCFDLRTGRAVAVEALVRWDHPEHGRIGPDDFIRLAEMSGLIQPLSRWVITRAIEVVAATPPEIQVSANLSARNLDEPDFVPWLSALVADNALPPGRLVLELTESEVMADVTAASGVLDQIAALGIGLALDDFGAGQSSLAHLRSLPMHELKIDRSLVRGVGDDDDVAIICGAVVDLAHRLGLRVVAEGAASPADVRALRAMGCDRAQGFYLGEPLPAEALDTLGARSVADALETPPDRISTRTALRSVDSIAPATRR